MEVITSLILLSILVLPPMMLAGKEAVELFFPNQNSSRPGQLDAPTSSDSDQAKAAVYDGMATVEIPVMEPQVVAYEPVLPPGEDDQIEFIDPPGRVSNA